jgi:hypothetical protein
LPRRLARQANARSCAGGRFRRSPSPALPLGDGAYEACRIDADEVDANLSEETGDPGIAGRSLAAESPGTTSVAGILRHIPSRRTEAHKARPGLGGTVIPGSPAEFGKFVADETEKWAKVIKLASAKAE